MPDQDGARIDARAFLSGQERLEIQGRPVLLLSDSFALAVCRVSVRCVLHPTNNNQKIINAPRVSKRIKKQKLSSGSIGVCIRVKTCQNVSTNMFFHFLILFFDTCALAL